MKTWLARFHSQSSPYDLQIGAKQMRMRRGRDRLRTLFAPRPAAELEMTGETGLALLPFTDLAPRPDHPYLADGFTRDLAQVISLNPSFFAEAIDVPHTESAVAGEAVAVGHNLLLEGTVARVNRHLSATVRVVESSSGYILWSDRFSAPLEHAAMLQDDIAEAIAGAVTSTPYFLRVETRPRGTSCAAAWALRQAARSLLHDGPGPFSLDGAARLFSHAARLDPLYADAKIGLAETLSLRTLLLAAADADADRARRDIILDAAEVLSPSHDELTFIRGLKELDSGNAAQAASALGRSIRVSAIMIPARLFLSLAEARSGRGRAARNDAVLAFRRAGRPGWAALADYARAEAALARGAPHEAETAIRDAIASAGGAGKAPPPVLLLHSLMLAGQGKPEAARAVLADHWPASLSLPARAELEAWLAALPGSTGEAGNWLDDIVGPLRSSPGN